MAPTQTALNHMGIIHGRSDAHYNQSPRTPPPTPDADQFRSIDKLASSRLWHQTVSDGHHREDPSGYYLPSMRFSSDDGSGSPLSESSRTSPFEGSLCQQPRSSRSPRDSNYRRGPWSSSEDDQLIMLVRKNGASNWVHISSRMGRRTPKQCRERYHQNLKPTLNRNQITDEEGQEILRHVAEIGKQWAEIARRMHDRSDNAVKNWWNGYENRRKRTERRNAMAKQASHHHAPDISVDSTAASPQDHQHHQHHHHHHHQHYQYTYRYHRQHYECQQHLAQAADRDPRMRIDTLLS